MINTFRTTASILELKHGEKGSGPASQVQKSACRAEMSQPNVDNYSRIFRMSRGIEPAEFEDTTLYSIPHWRNLAFFLNF